MKKKIKILILSIFLLSLLTMSFILISRYASAVFADKTWITDFGYKENEIHELTFNWVGDRSCPDIPVKVANDIYNMGFDTGCGVGIFFTNVMEGKIVYTLLGQNEALNRDGSHRGWSKHVNVNDIEVFGDTYKSIDTTISDWSMFSSEKFNGTIGLAYFKGKIITLDYAGHRIAVSDNHIDYEKLDLETYTVLPLYKTTSEGQQDLLFFEAEYNDKSIIVYLDTGKNYSYLHNPDCYSTIGDKPTILFDVPLKIGNMELLLKDMTEANIAQADGLPYPTMIELNSDQIWKCSLLVTIDLIDQKIIFRKMV